MRELINLLNESRGLGARRSGEEFVSTSNPDDKIYVDSVMFYPRGSTAYESYEQMVDELKDLVETLSTAESSVNLITNFSTKDRAFGVATFQRPDKTKLIFVKPFKEVKLDPTQNNWDNQTGIPGFKYNSKAAAKTQAGMTPQDILVEFNDLSPSGIVAQIEKKFGITNPLTQLSREIASGQKLPITISATKDMSFTAFRDYFCELLHPIALHVGSYTGNAGQAAKKFLGLGGFANTSISFGKDKTEGLSDSLMTSPEGKQIKVSSKGAKGAEASAKNILDSVNELSVTDPKLLNKHKEVVDLIRDIVTFGQAGAPIHLGVKYKIIDEEDADDIKSFKKMPLMPLDKGIALASKKLGALMSGRQTDRPENVNLYYHAMAAVAHKVAEYVNENTKFGDAASEILNNGALVQIYTKATEKGDQWTVESFDTHWPSDTVSDVIFSAGKNYFSTDIKGNFTFKILRNKAKDVADERSTQAVLSPKKIAAPSAITGKRVSIRPKRSGPESGSVGREKRNK